MGSDRNIVILTDDIDILVGRVGDDIDFGIAVEKVRYKGLTRGSRLHT